VLRNRTSALLDRVNTAALGGQLLELLQSNTRLTMQDKELTEHVAQLTREIHALICKPDEPAAA